VEAEDLLAGSRALHEADRPFVADGALEGLSASFVEQVVFGEQVAFGEQAARFALHAE